MAAEIYWAINWLGVFATAITLYYILFCVGMMAFFFVIAFSCSQSLCHFCQNFIFFPSLTSDRHNTFLVGFFFYTREECFYINVHAASYPALWTAFVYTIVSLFSTHLNKCNAFYVYSCGNKPNEEDVNAISALQQMSHSARRLPFENEECGWKSNQLPSSSRVESCSAFYCTRLDLNFFTPRFCLIPL